MYPGQPNPDEPYSSQPHGAQPHGQQPVGPLPPMGWYPDPANATQERYWDGAAWTYNTRPIQAPAPAYGQAYQQPVDSWGQQQGSYVTSPVQAYGYAAGPSTADGVPLAGWWWRVLAAIIDGIVLYVVGLIVQIPFNATLTPAVEAWTNDYLAWVSAGSIGDVPLPWDPAYAMVGPLIAMTVINLLVAILYATFLLVSKAGTLGMLATGLRVVTRDQGQQHSTVALGTALIRNVAFYVMQQIPIVGQVNVLLPLFNKRRQTLHDMLANTQVVKIT